MPVAQTSPPNICLNKQTERFGIFPLNAGTLSPTVQDEQLLLQTGVWYNVKGPMVWKDRDFVMDPFIKQKDGVDYYCYPLSGFGSGATVSIAGSFGTSTSGVQIGDTIDLKVTDGSTSVVITTTATANNQWAWNIVSTSIDTFFATDATLPTIGKFVGRPGIAFQIRYTSIGGTGNITSITLSNMTLLPYAASYSTQQLILAPIDWPDQSQYLSIVTNYRPVSASAWIAYEGSDLSNGGQHTCIMYRGGQHPNSIGLYDYDGINSVPTCYEGPLKLGSYQFWMPVSTNDTSMRRPVNSGEWTHPYMAIAGIVSTPTQINALRIRCIANFEFVSDSQLWSYKSTRPSPGKILHATQVLHGHPTSMENPLHFGMIKDVIKRAISTAQSFGGWIDSNKGWIIPAATAIGTALL